MMNIKSLFILIGLWITLPLYSQENAAEVQYGNNPQAGHIAVINGIDMYYEVYGTGKPMLIIHGNGQSIVDLSPQIAYFSAANQVIVADSRGHGKSGLGEAELNYIQMMEDYNSLLTQLQIKQANVIGWSDGGIQALLLAIHHPDKVVKMATMGANLRPDATAINDWVPGLLQPLSDYIDKMIATADTSADWKHQQQLLNILRTQPNIAIEELHKIKAPVLVMAGDKDIIRAEHTLEIFNNIPNAHLAILPGQTHWAPATDAETFNSLVDKFFTNPYTRPTSEAILTAELKLP